MSILKMVCAPLGLAALLTATSASAEPYEIYAKFRPLQPDGKVIELPINIKTGTSSDKNVNNIIPDSSSDHVLTGIYVRLKKDDISRGALPDVRDLVFYSEINGVEKFIKRIEISTPPLQDELLISTGDSRAIPSGQSVTIRVRSKPTSKYLCAQETAMRTEEDWKEVDKYPASLLEHLNIPPDKPDAPKEGAQAAPKPGAQAALKPGAQAAPKADPQAAAAMTLNPANLTEAHFRALAVLKRARPNATSDPILFTFCPGASDVMKWEDMCKKRAGDGPVEPGCATKLRDVHKHSLSERLATYMEKAQKISNIEVGRDRPQDPENVYVSNEHSLTLVRSLSQEVHFTEVDNLERFNISDRAIVDQDSRIELVVSKEFCAKSSVPCAELIHDYLGITLSSSDKTGKPIRKDVEIESQGQSAKLKISLSELLGQTVTLTVWYRNNGNDMKIYESPTKVSNLGLVTTFPVISEVVALATKAKVSEASSRDVKVQSSIPVSFAYNMSAGDGRHVAVTLPWMIGFNPRIAPNLADIVKVFPHVSFIFPVSKDASTGKTSSEGMTSASASGDDAAKGHAQIAFGAGVAFVNAFTLSWAIAADTGAHYALIGVSVPELIETMNW